MKRLFLLIFWTCCITLSAQSKMYIHNSDNMTLGVPLSAVDSISLTNGGSTLFIRSGNIQTQFPITKIDSISFAENSDTVFVEFKDDQVIVFNPLAFEDVTVQTSGSYVVITSTSEVKDLNFKVSGASADGMLKIYSESRFNLIMNDLALTCSAGPAINIQSGSKVSVILPKGTENSITDGTTYADTYVNNAGVTEDQNAALFSKGDLIFSGNGSLTINGRGTGKHGIYTKDEMKFSEATLVIKSAAKDGIHPKDGLTVESGYISVTSADDAIDADDGYVRITGGNIVTNTSAAGADGISSLVSTDISNAEINITVSGDKAKGLKSGGNINLGNGNITVISSGATILEASGSGYDPSYPCAIKSDTSVFINGASITIQSTGKGGKGISADKNIIMTSGSVNVTSSGAGATYKNADGVNDSYHSTCLGADGNITILGGSVITSSSGAAGRGITSDGRLIVGDYVNGPNISVTTQGAKILVSGSGNSAEYDEAKAISADGAIFINNGDIKLSSADDAMKSDSSVTINNGSVVISKSIEGIEAQYITVNNGNISVVSSDDGINTTKGIDGESSDGSCLYIYGGQVSVNATSGDGIDSNGDIVMTGGTVIVNGPPSAPEVALDYNGNFNVSGGLLVASGPNSGNMIEATSTTSAQNTIKATTNGLISSSTIFNIQDASGSSLLTFKPLRSAYYIVFSSPLLKSGSTYSIYTGGTSTGTYTNGLYTGGTYTGGTLKKSFTIAGKVTSVSF